MVERCTQADIDEARRLVPHADPKVQQQVARALARRMRMGSELLQAKVSYMLSHSAKLSDEADNALLFRLAEGDPNFRVIISWFSQCARAWRAELLGEPAPEEHAPAGAYSGSEPCHG